MARLFFWFAVLVAVTFGATWLADSPGEISILVRGYRIESQSIGAVVLAIGLLFVAIWIIWGIFKWVVGRPSAFGGFFSRRRERKGRQALSTGLVAMSAGDQNAAQKAAVTASRLLPDDPLAKLLAAQSAQQQGDSARVKQVYNEMAKTSETKLLGLRGLFTEARREKDIEAAREIAKQALEENPGVSWASNAMLVSYAGEKNWLAVLAILDNQLKTQIIDKATAAHKKAVVLTAQAMEAEDIEPETALDLATKAHKLDPSLVPAAVVAGRTSAAGGSLRKASRILEKTWSLTPHPDIAEVYAHARPGDSVKDRQARIKTLLRSHHGGQEGALASALIAVEAQDWENARQALNPFVIDQPNARVCTLMAEIEAAEFGDKGRSREWLARAVHAPRDPAWTTQGFIVPQWLPVSPLNGELGAFEWKVPLQGLAFTEQQRQAATAPFLTAEETPNEDEIIVIESQEVEVKETLKTPEDIPVTKSKEDLQPEVDTVEKKVEKEAKKTGEKTHRLPDDPGPKKADKDNSGESWFG